MSTDAIGIILALQGMSSDLTNTQPFMNIHTV